MVWEPFALALLFGLLISAGIYFVVMWPQVAPDDDDLDAGPVEAATPVAAVTAAEAPGPVAAVAGAEDAQPVAAVAGAEDAQPVAAVTAAEDAQPDDADVDGHPPASA